MSIPLNPFVNSSLGQRHSNALQSAEEQRSIAEVQAAMLTAKKFPRDPVAAMDRILQACTRPTLAENALYAYPRGTEMVTGPSIRLAESIAQNWGNMAFGIRELSQTHGASIVEAFAWDIETNTRQVKTFQVPHIRYSKKHGNKPLTDPRDIYEMVANQGARRLRACILGVVPGDVVDAAVKQSELTLANSGGAPEEQIKKLVEAFREIGVSSEMIVKRLGHRLDSIISAEIIQLRKIYASIKGGMAAVEDFFETGGAEQSGRQKTQSLKEKLKSKIKDPPETDPPKEGPGEKDPPFSQAEEAKPNPDLVHAILQGLADASTEEEILEAEDLIRELKHPEDKAECQKMLAEKRAKKAN
jgi:hypothetical protein